MKKYSFLTILLIFFDCTSLKHYAINRKNDFLDIFTIGVEKEVYGIGITELKLYESKKGIGFGLKNGHFGFINWEI
jgi:hypothetical protein